MDIRAALTAAAVAVAAYLFVGAFRRYALARRVLDLPNARSSHAVPTPRGGGAGVLIAAIAGFLLVGDGVGTPALFVIAAIIPTAVAGWMDDHRMLGVWPRFFAQLASGFLLVPTIITADSPPWVSIVAALLCIFVTVSAINVVNFMDGIDGIIGIQSVVFAAHLVLLAGVRTDGGELALMMGAASAGFLVWNWPPARIFLGDVGSGGIAVLALGAAALAWQSERLPFISVFLPLYGLFLDATVTLLRRARARQPLYQAHRSHLYQRLAIDGAWGHRRVTMLYGAVSLVGVSLMALTAPNRATVFGLIYFALVTWLGAFLDKQVSPKGTQASSNAPTVE